MTETIVSSGAFRVDRERAIEVLRRHQLPDPRDFLLPWIGLAAASGATNVELYARLRGLELRFDGRPIPAEKLRDPFECLFGEQDRAPQLVAGLLGALRLSPKRVQVRSGEPGLRVRLVIDRWERQSLAPDSEDTASTSLEVEWRGLFQWGLTRDCLLRAKAARARSTLPVYINGRLS
ncbi:MAG: hypothetical protein HY553_10515 [Elusimicrobia bacterium]|nr:hypothetical protein [Elusimicrobiota bacterium]